MTQDIAEQLKAAIVADGRPPAEIAQLAGVHRQIVERFVLGERDMRMATAAKVAKVLGLEFKEPRKRRS